MSQLLYCYHTTQPYKGSNLWPSVVFTSALVTSEGSLRKEETRKDAPGFFWQPKQNIMETWNHSFADLYSNETEDKSEEQV